MDKAIKDKSDFTFLADNICPFYSLPTGRSSCYGEQSFATLKSLSSCHGFDIKNWKQTLYDTFGEKKMFIKPLSNCVIVFSLMIRLQTVHIFSEDILYFIIYK